MFFLQVLWLVCGYLFGSLKFRKASKGKVQGYYSNPSFTISQNASSAMIRGFKKLIIAGQSD